MIISLLQKKGGCGKTTIALNLAHSFKNRGYKTLLIDADPQASARDWHTANNGDVLDVIGLERPTIDKDIQRFTQHYDYIFIDGAPDLSVMAAKTILCSDLILIPVQPGAFDIWAVDPIVSLIKERQAIKEGLPRTAFVVSMRVKNTTLGKEVNSVLAQYGLPVLECGTFRRQAYSTSVSKGETVLSSKSKYRAAANDIQKLTDEVIKFAHDNT